MQTSFLSLARLCEKLESTDKRLFMIEEVADFLNKLKEEEIEPAVLMILGKSFPNTSQKKLDVSIITVIRVLKRITKADDDFFTELYNRTGDVGSATKLMFESMVMERQSTLFQKNLTIMEVRLSFENIATLSGTGSKQKKERVIESLLSLASPLEVKYLVRILLGEMRTGFSDGLMEQAISKAFDLPLELVQSRNMILGNLGEVSRIAKVRGGKALSEIGFEVFRPVKLMLADTINDVDEVIQEHGGISAFEDKLDGARVQIHKSGDKIKIFSRRLTEVTDSLPEIVELVKRNVSVREVIFEGEVIAVDIYQNPIPFQHLMRRFKRIHNKKDMIKKIPVRLFLFDVLFLNGESLISIPYSQRRKILSDKFGGIPLTRQITGNDVKKIKKFLKEALDAGHEGLIAKKLTGEYKPGIRGKLWLKIKPTLEALDLVIVAAEYGHGRRYMWLSDYYLAARDENTNKLYVVGKTFKGLTDQEMIELTKQLKELIIKEEHRKVTVIPKIVVQVLYNEIQKSSKYESGMALRFARINAIREDKTPDEADTVQKIKNIFEDQFLKKGRYNVG